MKNKGADHLRVNAQRICALIFAYVISWFSHGVAHLIKRRPVLSPLLHHKIKPDVLMNKRFIM